MSESGIDSLAKKIAAHIKARGLDEITRRIGHHLGRSIVLLTFDHGAIHSASCWPLSDEMRAVSYECMKRYMHTLPPYPGYRDGLVNEPYEQVSKMIKPTIGST
jgi:hypothetical protein